MTNEEIHELAERFFGAIERTDVRTIEQCYDAAAVIWHNWDDRAQSRADNIAMLASFPQRFKLFKHSSVRRYPCGTGFVQQHVAEGIMHDGGSFRCRVCMVIRLQGNKIARIDEYVDSRELPFQLPPASAKGV